MLTDKLSHPNPTKTHTPAVAQKVTDKDQHATSFPTLAVLLLSEMLVKSCLYILNL